MHGEEWDGKQNLEGWWMSEKLDGFRAYWNGKKLLSRSGKDIATPSWFTSTLPSNKSLDGELWMGRDTYEKLRAILNSAVSMEDERWQQVKYMVFDLPGSKQP